MKRGAGGVLKRKKTKEQKQTQRQTQGAQAGSLLYPVPGEVRPMGKAGSGKMQRESGSGRCSGKLKVQRKAEQKGKAEAEGAKGKRKRKVQREAGSGKMRIKG